MANSGSKQDVGGGDFKRVSGRWSPRGNLGGIDVRVLEIDVRSAAELKGTPQQETEDGEGKGEEQTRQ